MRDFLGTVNGKSFLHQAGYEYSQEPSAMIVGTAAAAKPGEKVFGFVCGSRW